MMTGSLRPRARTLRCTPNLQAARRPCAHHMNVLTGLSHLAADARATASGDHTRACAAWLTGVHVYDRTRPGVEVKVATERRSALSGQQDRSATRRFSRSSSRCDAPHAGRLRLGRLLLRQHGLVAQRDDAERDRDPSARRLRAALFGDGGYARPSGLRASRSTGSLLDSVNAEAERLARDGSAPATAQRFTSTSTPSREIEKRIQNAEARGEQAIELPDRPTSIPATFEAHAELMFDSAAPRVSNRLDRVFSR